MFVGHIGAALAIGRAEPRVNVGAFVCGVVGWLGRRAGRAPD
jgi:hypothetical protein